MTSTRGPRCTFCNGAATWGPFPPHDPAHACDACVRLILSLASGATEDVAEIWLGAGASAAAPEAPPPSERAFEDFKRQLHGVISIDDAESNLHLAAAFVEMGRHGDALQWAAFSLKAGGRHASDALGLLLTPPLLRRGGLRVLRERIRGRLAMH